MSAIAAYALLLALVAAGFQFGARHIYEYAVTRTHFEVRLFGRLTVYRIVLRDISDVSRWRFSFADVAGAFTTLRLGNRIAGGAILIRRRGKFPPNIIVTPGHTGEMIDRLRAGSNGSPNGE